MALLLTQYGWKWLVWLGHVHDLKPTPFHRTIYFCTKIQIKQTLPATGKSSLLSSPFWKAMGGSPVEVLLKAKKKRRFFFSCSIFLILCLYYGQSTGLRFSEAGLGVFADSLLSLEYFVLVDHERRFCGEPHRAVPVHLRHFSDLWQEDKGGKNSSKWFAKSMRFCSSPKQIIMCNQYCLITWSVTQKLNSILIYRKMLSICITFMDVMYN